MQERLQKIISRAGVASRRHAEQLILAGQVTVNGSVVTKLGTKADPEKDSIKVAGRLLRFPEQKTYLLLNKPAGCVSTLSDPEGRKTLRSFLHGVRGRVYPVGRLDYHGEGALLLTNDGELANALLRAESLAQSYWIKVKGMLDLKQLATVEKESGVRLRLLKKGANPWYEGTLRDAPRDLLRKTLTQMGHLVEKFRRVKIGPLELGALEPGEYRPLTAGEVEDVRRAAAGIAKRPEARKRKTG